VAKLQKTPSAQRRINDCAAVPIVPWHGAPCCRGPRLSASIDKLEAVFEVHIWNVVLSRHSETSSVRLQSSTCDFKTAVDVIESLHSFTDDLRNRFDEFEAMAKELTEFSTVAARPCKRTGHFDKAKETEVVVHGRDKFSVESFLFIVDQLLSALENKIEAYIEIRNVLKWQRNLTI